VGNLQDQPEHELHQLDPTELPGVTAAHVADWRCPTRFLLLGSLDGFRSARVLPARHGMPGLKEAADSSQQEEFKAMKAAFGSLCDTLLDAGCLPALQMVARLPDAHYQENQWDVLNALCALLPILAAQLNVAMQSKGLVDHT